MDLWSTLDFTTSSSTSLDKREEFGIQVIISEKLRNQQPTWLNEDFRNGISANVLSRMHLHFQAVLKQQFVSIAPK